MDFEFNSEQNKFREELRDFLRAEVPLEKQEVFGLLTEEKYQFGREINRKLASRWMPSMLPRSGATGEPWRRVE